MSERVRERDSILLLKVMDELMDIAPSSSGTVAAAGVSTGGDVMEVDGGRGDAKTHTFELPWYVGIYYKCISEEEAEDVTC